MNLQQQIKEELSNFLTHVILDKKGKDRELVSEFTERFEKLVYAACQKQREICQGIADDIEGCYSSKEAMGIMGRVKEEKEAQEILKKVCRYKPEDVIEDSDDITVGEAIEAITSHYISKDKAMEMTEFSMGYGLALGNGIDFERMHGKNETLIKFKEILKKQYGL